MGPSNALGKIYKPDAREGWIRMSLPTPEQASRPVPVLRSREDFNRTIDVFHRDNNDQESDKIFLEALQHGHGSDGRPPEYEDLVFILNRYLRETYGMGRVLGRSDEENYKDPVLDSLTEVLWDRWSDISNLNRHKVWEVEKSSTLFKEVEFIFDYLLTNWRLEPKKPWQCRQRTSVGVAKLLAVLAPNVCVIWDRKYVLERGLDRLRQDDFPNPWYPSDCGLGYAQYLCEKGRQVAALSESLGLTPERLETELVQEHSSRLSELYPSLKNISAEPLTKILDEANYLGLA